MTQFNLTGHADEPGVFWGEIGPCEHLVQVWDDDHAFLDTLEGFVAGGLARNDGVIVIATGEHLAQLEQRLTGRGIDLAAKRADGQYVDRDAAATLDMFMDGQRPDERRFEFTVLDLVERAATGGRRVRAFGEMVAMLWARGDQAATMRLEKLWHDLCHKAAFTLLCAYPRVGFTHDADKSIKEICDAHSRVLHS
jgi:hypothetical protein